MTEMGRRAGDMFKSVYDPDEDGVIAVAQTEADMKLSTYDPNEDGVIAVAQTEAVKYVDRGDPDAYDFALTNLTADDAWRDLDLSGILPAGVRLAHLFLHVHCVEASIYSWLRENGNSNEINVTRFCTGAERSPRGVSRLVRCDEDRKIEYRIAVATWIFYKIQVVGWFI